MSEPVTMHRWSIVDRKGKTRGTCAEGEVKQMSFCESGVRVAFLDGETRLVKETTFSRCLVAAAHLRLIEGASGHLQLTVDASRTCELNKLHRLL